MKKIMLGILAFFMCFLVVGCDKENVTTGNDGESGNSEKIECTATKSNDFFVDSYEYAKDYMMPDDGVYTGFYHQELYVGDPGYFYFVVECIDEVQMEKYGEKLVNNGFEFKNNAYYDYTNNVKITLSKMKSSYRMNVYVYPSVN